MKKDNRMTGKKGLQVKSSAISKSAKQIIIPEETLFRELSLLIEKSKQKVVSQAKSAVNLLFWQIGKRINEEILHNKRAEYGAQIVQNLAEKLSFEHGSNFELRNLRRMMQFANGFSDKKIVSTLSTQLSWSHIVELLPLQTLEAKIFYANEVINENMSVRDLRKTIARKAFERVHIANAQISKKSKIPQGTFKDPYLFDFLGLKNAYLEKDIETIILRDLESFILELGGGFAFVERQKRMILTRKLTLACLCRISNILCVKETCDMFRIALHFFHDLPCVKFQFIN